LGWLSGWGYRKSRLINYAAGAGTNYQMKIAPRLFSSTMPCANAGTYQTTPTYDGSGQCLHPDIVYFATAWHGYKYWMAMTPYPNNSPTYEKPSILACNDGVSWEVPAGLTNPIDTSSDLSDTELFYDEASDQLWCYYRQMLDRIYRMVSGDGINWSGKTEVLSGPNNSLLSPCVVKVGSTYYMWVVDRSGTPVVKLYSSSNGTSWSLVGSCTIIGTLPSGSELWHMNVIYNSDTDDYWMFMDYFPLYKVGFLRSKDRVNWYLMSPLFLQNNSAQWDDQVQRIAPVLIGNTLHVWYAGASSTNVWHIGYTTATIDADTGIIIKRAKGNLEDIRFTGSDGSTVLDYWLDPTSIDYIQTANFWVEIQEDLSTENKTVYLYYGKSDAPNVSNGNNTFILFDDFSTLDPAKWDSVIKGVGGSVSVVSGELILNPDNATLSSASIRSLLTFTNTICITLRRKYSSGTRYFIDASLGAGNEVDENGAETAWQHTTRQSGYYWYYQNSSSAADGLYRMPASGGKVALATAAKTIFSTSYRVFQLIYAENGKIKWIRDTTQEYSATDTTFLNDAKKILISQGSDASNGTDSYIDYLYVRKCVDVEPTLGAWGSEEEESGGPVYKDFSDSGVGADALAALEGSMTIIESGSGVDAPTLEGSMIISESGSGLDTPSMEGQLSLSDSGAGADTPTLESQVPISDTGLGSDSLSSLEAQLSLADSGIGSEYAVAGIFWDITDSGVGSDIISGLQASVPILDTGIGSDVLNALQAEILVLDSGVAVEIVTAGGVGVWVGLFGELEVIHPEVEISAISPSGTLEVKHPTGEMEIIKR